jgi:hypothetical protein
MQDKLAEIKELTREDLLEMEEDLLSGLMAAVESKDNDTTTITIQRGDRVFFKFRVRRLDDDEVKEIKDRNSTFVKNSIGVKVRSDFDDVRFSSEVIYRATIEDDRKKLWDNPEAKKKLNCLDGIEVIGRALASGEKDAVYDKIQKFCGYRDEEEIGNLTKNS